MEQQDQGVPLSGSGHSAEPEPISVVSAETASVPNAGTECVRCGHHMNSVRYARYVGKDERGDMWLCEQCKSADRAVSA